MNYFFLGGGVPFFEATLVFAAGANFATLVLNLMTWHKNVLLVQHLRVTSCEASLRDC